MPHGPSTPTCGGRIAWQPAQPQPAPAVEMPAEDAPERDRVIRCGYGACSRCSCPEFFGTSGYTCQRGGCAHHYDEHW